MTKTFWEHLLRAILETCDLWDICSEWWEDMTWPKKLTKTKTKTFWEHLLRAILETCDIWDTDYNSDNWEPEFMTIFVTWQLIVTLDSIRNSCDVYLVKSNLVNQVAVHSVRRALPGYKLEDLPERWFLSPPPLDSLFWITQIETIHSDGAQAELLSGYFAALLWCITTGTLSTRWVGGWGAVGWDGNGYMARWHIFLNK